MARFGVSEVVIWSYLGLFHLLRKGFFRGFRQWPGSAVALAVEDDTVSAVAETVESGCAEDAVRESLAPLIEVEV